MWGLSIIDGTGPGNWNEYIGPKWFEHSFCRQMYEQMIGNGSAMYQQGPTWDGWTTSGEGQKAGDYLVDLATKQGCDNLVLAGYSRGAAAVVESAQFLAKKKLTVKAIFLFDPVAWYPFQHCDDIPDNIENVFIARRNLHSPMVKKYPDQMRESYGETAEHYALRFKGKLRVSDAKFPATHGAMGGTGWANVPEDVTGQSLVAGFMNHQLASIGLDISLRSYPCTGGT